MPADYTLADLEALSGIPARTIRYYIAQGLIPSPGREGPSTRYPEGTLKRLRVISRLRDAHLPLAAIRSQLAGLDDAAVASLAEAPVAEPAAGTDSALDYVRRLLGERPRVAEAAAPYPLPPAPPAAAPAPPRAALFMEVAAQRSRPAPAMPVPPVTAPDAPAPTPPAAPAPVPPALGERSQWDRIQITPDIELHVRRPLTRADNRLVERLLAFARQLQEGTK